MSKSRKKSKALPRRDRAYPQVARVFSFNFDNHFDKLPGKSFVSHEDYTKLLKKYFKLFARYQRHKWKNDASPSFS